MLFDVHDLFLLVEENQVNREKHTDCMNSSGGHDPEATAELRPSPCLSQKTDKAWEITVGDGSFGGKECFPCLVVDIEWGALTITRHTLITPLSSAGLLLQCQENSYYSMTFRLRRQMMMNRTTTARAAAAIRISVTLSIS